MARILLVDENPVTRALSRKTLLLAGHTVVDAMTCADAEAMLEAAPIDVIVMETPLPDADAVEAIERVRAARAGMPIVQLAAEDDRDTTALASLAGTPTWRVRKPPTPHELSDAVARAADAAVLADERIVLPEGEHAREER